MAAKWFNSLDTNSIERAYNGFYNFLTYSVYFFDVVACIIGSITICYALKKVVFENYAWILLILGWIRFNTIVFGSPRTPSIRRQVNGDTAMIQ